MRTWLIFSLVLFVTLFTKEQVQACKDLGDCTKFANKCGQDAIKEICPKTCGACQDVNPVCKDLGDCTKLASKCGEKGVKEICPKTCGTCRDVSPVIACGILGTPPCNTASKSTCVDLGDCSKLASKCDQKGVKEICPRTCGTCRDVTPANSCGTPGQPPCNTGSKTACKDLGDCSKLASKCDQKGVKEICPRTCGTCRDVTPANSCGTPGQPPCNTGSKTACKDLGDCSKLASKCGEKGVQDICPKTCGTCKEEVPSVSSCKDTNSLCGVMVSSCSIDTVQKICVKTCDLCPKVGKPVELTPPSVDCKDVNTLCSKLIGACNDEEVRKQCRATCGACETPIVCEEKNELCPKLIDFCDDQLIRKNCPVSCNLCVRIRSANCEDTNPLCSQLITSCGDQSVRKVCGKTCGCN